MNRVIALIAVVLLFHSISFAQDEKKLSWRKHKNLAEQLIVKRSYAEAASHYEMAFRQKPSKPQLINAAAENYLLVRDFRNAANAFGQVLKFKDKFPMAGMHYGMSLKQDERYDEASIELSNFIATYEGEDKPFLSDVVQREIDGCQFAMNQKMEVVNSPFVIDHLSSKINTDRAEFAPIKYTDDLIYYSSMVKGKAKIFRSQKSGENWSKGRIPRGFSKLADKHFCNGSFSPDGARFYFTICESDQVWGELSARCDIYVTMKKGSAWKEPVKLPEYINLPNCTTTQPFVTVDGGQEILYFSTNRSNGQGGMDLWFVERELNQEAMDFTFPVNMGPNINTKGDEITPYFDTASSKMFFSSTGHLTMGGFDILSSTGSKASWTAPENLGAPFNSAADDSYFTSYEEGETGYLVSNRRFGMDKIITTQEDIFSYTMPGQQFVFKGFVNDELEKPLEEVYSYLYEFLNEDGERRLLTTKITDQTGAYLFRLLPGKRYQLTLEKENFASVSEFFNTLSSIELIKEKNIAMTRINPSLAIASNETMVNGEELAEVVTEEFVEKTGSEDEKFEEVTVVENKEIVEDIILAEEEAEAQEPKAVELSETSVSPEYTEEKISTEGENSLESNSSLNSESTEIVAVPVEIVEEVKSNEISNEIVTSTIAESSDVVDISSNRMMPALPTGTGIYRYDESTNAFIKEGSDITVEVNPIKKEPKVYETKIVESKADVVIERKTVVSDNAMTHYKIQLIAVKTHNPNHKRYAKIKNIGKMETEFIEEKGWTRVLLSDYSDKNSARKDLERIQGKGFERAYIVKYKNEQRIGRIK